MGRTDRFLVTPASVRETRRSVHPDESHRAGRVDCGPDARRDYELTVLWRTIVWPNPAAESPARMREELDPHERLLGISLEALEAGLETRIPSQEDLSILLRSSDSRVRLAGVRLVGRGQQIDRDAGGQ